MELKEIEALLHLFERSSLTEMVIEESGMRLTFKRQEVSPQVLPPEVAPVAPPKRGEAKGGIGESQKDRLVVRSPCVGMFSCRPKPDSDPFVKAGDQVQAGDTVAVVDAMKVLTEVKAAEAGIVKQILVEDGQPVEYGQELMIIAPLSS